MSNITDYFIKGSDNVLSQTLTEDGDAIAVSWTEITIIIGSVSIVRTANERGVSFSSGLLEITPSGIDEDLSALVVGRLYRVKVVVKSASDPDGVVFGGDDSENKLYYQIGQNPA